MYIKRCLSAFSICLLVTLFGLPTAVADVSEKRFIKSLTKGQLTKVERYLERGVDEDVRRKGLHWAIKAEKPEALALLAPRVAFDETEMRLALERSESMLAVLVDAGGRFRRPSLLWEYIRKKDEATALAVLAAGEGLHRAVPVVGVREVSRQDNAILVERFEDPAGMTALYLAVKNGLHAVAGKLLEAGADPAAIVLVRPGSVTGVDLERLQAGERATVPLSATIEKPMRSTALIAATHARSLALITLLLEAGAPVVGGADGSLDACGVAWAMGQPPGIDLLCPWEELLRSAQNGDTDAVAAALERGVDANVIDPRGNAPLQYASYEGHLDVIRLLLAGGADPEGAPGSHWYSPLQGASRLSSPEAVRLLTEAGADVNRYSGGDLPLQTWSLDVVKALVSAGANPELPNSDGANAMAYANSMGRLEIVDYLRSQGFSYGPAFVADTDKELGEVVHGGLQEAVLMTVADGGIRLRGHWAGRVGFADLSCNLTEIARDAVYYHAPALVAGRNLPRRQPLITLHNDDLRRYVGTVVRVTARDGKCSRLLLPAAEPDDAADLEQLKAALQGVEVHGNLFGMLTTGRGSMVFPGTLESFENEVVLVELAGGLRTRCKMHSRVSGMHYGLTSMLEGVFTGQRIEFEDVTREEDILNHIGKPVLVGPGMGRCEFFRLQTGNESQ